MSEDLQRIFDACPVLTKYIFGVGDSLWVSADIFQSARSDRVFYALDPSVLVQRVDE